MATVEDRARAGIEKSRLTQIAIPPGHREILKATAAQSFLVVPILVFGQPVATLMFVFTRHSARRYGADDIEWAVSVAARARLSIERIMLRDELERANLVKEEFFATLSHELQNPVNLIGGYVRLLESGTLDHGLRERTSAALERNVGLLHRLVRELVDVARIVSGGVKLEMAPLPVSTVVADVLNAAKPSADAKRIAVECITGHAAAWVLADRSRLQEVMWHLLSNAIKFTPPCGRVNVRLQSTDSEVQIIISDSGVGLSTEILPRIFESFWQEDPRFSRIHGGLGLGLALVRRIVQLHGGTVRAESPGEGEGTTFIVTLPLLPRPEPDDAVSNSLIARLAGLRVLLVENDESWAQPLVDLLTLAGADVCVERSGQSISSRLQADRPHIILIDVDQPHVVPSELLAAMRTDPSKDRRTIRAAALTRNEHSDERRRALAAGFQMVLPKSIAAEDFLDAVLRLAAMDVDTRPAP
jgi:signal transduction histidine kinase/CheY-like chemotaxis protein